MPMIAKLRRLSPREFWILAQAMALLPTVRLVLRVATIARLQSLGGRAAHRASPNRLSPEAMARLVRIAAERGVVRANCLEQSLVLQWLLQRQGIDARISFGARKADKKVEAHAWVECSGLALNEDRDVCLHFSPFEGDAGMARTLEVPTS